jgi:crotonobetainyl-CoA:carnitine CoA-transferase CaiB-like acyl-CoA transferase
VIVQPEPLAGIRVVEMSAGVLGPMCGVYLSDMGADVVKVEPPEGDLSRYARGVENPLPPESPSPFFTAVNRGKRSVVVDATSPLGHSALHRLLGTADVFLSNYRSAALARLGVDEATLRSANERIVYAVASGFGGAGPDAGRPMVDGSGQARGGLASVTGRPGEPALAGAVVADSTGALLLALAVTTALVSRERYGVGQRVDISALGGQLWLQSWELAHASMTGFVPTSQGPHHPIFAGVYGMYRTSDDRTLFIAGIASAEDWEALCRFGDMMDVCRDPRWDTNQKRAGFDSKVPYREVNALRPRLKEAFARRSLAEWEEFLNSRPDIIFHRVQGYAEVLADEQVAANGYLAEVDVFNAGPQRLVGNVVGLSVTPGSVKGGPASLGEHTQAVLTELGFSLTDVSAIRDEAKDSLARKLPGMNLKPDD